MDFSKTSSSDSELQQLIVKEQEKAQVNEIIMKTTSDCWDKCITGTIGSKFSSSETSCLSNCALRYMDLSHAIMSHLQSRSSMR